MKWEGLNLHIENLLPGILNTVLLYMLLPQTMVASITSGVPALLLKNNFLLASCFFAAAYINGVICVAISRLILDRLSEALPRPILLRMLSRGKLSDRTLREVNDDYRRSISVALHSGNQAIVDEVLQRRQRGRLARTSLIPVVLFSVFATSCLGMLPRFLLIAGVLVVLLFVYAYIEVTIYEECQLEVRHAEQAASVDANRTRD